MKSKRHAKPNFCEITFVLLKSSDIVAVRLDYRGRERMKRWFYILLGAFGVMLVMLSIFTMIETPAIPLAYTQWLLPSQVGLIILGSILACAGFLNGKKAGEFDVRQYVKSARKRDHRVDGTEIDFACPACNKSYRASPLLAGKPFSCRECGGTFIVKAGVPSISSKTSPAA
jgi:uncharacterized integral membrane protein